MYTSVRAGSGCQPLAGIACAFYIPRAKLGLFSCFVADGTWHTDFTLSSNLQGCAKTPPRSPEAMIDSIPCICIAFEVQVATLSHFAASPCLCRLALQLARPAPQRWRVSVAPSLAPILQRGSSALENPCPRSGVLKWQQLTRSCGRTGNTGTACCSARRRWRLRRH